MFTLEFFDRNGLKLQLGDIVKISNGKSFDFYAEVKYLQEEQIITPFHTFSFHSVVKIDQVPENAVKSSEERYNVWYLPTRDQLDIDPEHGERYLMSWRNCEYALNEKMFRIKLRESE